MRRERRAALPRACETAGEWLPALAVGDEHAVPAPVRAHAATCLRCQAEAARYRRAVRDLHAGRPGRPPAPAEGLAATLEALHRAGPPRRPTTTYLGIGGAVATAAGAAAGVGVLVWRSRRRPLAG